MEAIMDDLKALAAKATDGDLADGGRYFGGTCVDLTRCNHGDTGEYRNEHDGRLIEALWNAYRAGTIGDTAAAEAKGYERGLREAAELALQYRDDAGGSQSYKQACHHINKAILAKLEKTDD